MNADEQLAVLGYPSVKSLASAARVDYVDFSDYTAASVRKMAGNGMNIPCAGFTLLMAVLCIDAK